MLTAHVAELSGRYAQELGENAYAVLNVFTDLASHTPAIRHLRRERNSRQRMAGSWISNFAQRCRHPGFRLTEYIVTELKADEGKQLAFVAR
jgi:hypothetical protein